MKKINKKEGQKKKILIKRFRNAGTDIKLHFKTKINIRKQKNKNHVPFGQFLIYGISINLILIILIFVFRKSLPPQIPLFYGLPEGEEQLTSGLMLSLPSILSLIVSFLNLGLSFIIQEEFIKRALILSSLLVTIFSLITTFKIFFLVGNI